MARALVALSSDMVRKAQMTHDASPTATAALGRSLTAAALMGSQIKNEQGSVTLSFRGDGPLGGITCVARPNGTVKGYVDHPQCEVARIKQGKLNVGGAVGRGFLSVIRDSGELGQQPYVGQTQIRTGESAEGCAYYFSLSEQRPSLVSLGVLLEGGLVVGAGGIILQPMPGAPEDMLVKLEGVAAYLEGLSHTCKECDNVEDLCAATLGSLSYEILETQPLLFACDCNRERLERALVALGKDELTDMIAQQHGAQMHCHFCNRTYDFTGEDLEKLLAMGVA
jgi:molecular chaperone Hsp33